MEVPVFAPGRLKRRMSGKKKGSPGGPVSLFSNFVPALAERTVPGHPLMDDPGRSSFIRLLPPWRRPTHICGQACHRGIGRSEEHTSELQSLMRISYAVLCLKKKKNKKHKQKQSQYVTTGE